MALANHQQPFRLGALIVYPGQNRIEGADGQIALEPQLMRILVLLATHHGHTISREQLIEEIWSQAFVSEHAVNRAISKLRKGLRDGDPNSIFIETIPKTGYRLVLPPQPIAFESDPLQSAGLRPRAKLFWLWFGGTISAGLLLWMVWLKSAPNIDAQSLGRQPAMDCRPLTSLAGYETDAAPRPNSSDLTFSHYRYEGPDSGQWDIYQLSATGQVTTFLREDGDQMRGKWSWDGSRFAYLSRGIKGSQVMVREADGNSRVWAQLPPHIAFPELAWLPNHDSLLLTYRDTPTAPYRIAKFHESNIQILTDPPIQYYGDRQPVVSPDGKQLAFVRFRSQGIGDLFTLNLATSEILAITRDFSDIQGLMWLSNQQLLFSSNRAGNFSLWQWDLQKGTRSYVPTQGRNATRPVPGREPGAVIYEEWKSEINILRMKGSKEARPVISTHWDWQAMPSPDGKQLAFLSNRRGETECWLANIDGSNARAIKTFSMRFSTSLSWSHRGDALLLAIPNKGQFDLYRMDPNPPHALEQLTSDAGDQRFPTFGPKSRDIYFTSNQSGLWQIMRMPADGGKAQYLTRQGGYVARFGGPEERLYFTRKGESGLWRLDPEQITPPTRIIADFPAQTGLNWWVTDSQIVYLRDQGNMNVDLVFHDLIDHSQTHTPLSAEIYPFGGLYAESNGAVWIAVIDKSDSDLWMVSDLKQDHHPSP